MTVIIGEPTFTHSGDAGQDHAVDESTNEGHSMLKGLASWADRQVDYGHLRKVIEGLPHLAHELPRA